MRFLSLFLIGSALCTAQYAGLTLPPSGGNPKASVTQYVGPVRVSIDYSSPRVNNRRGKIWGTLVPYGLTDPGFGTAKSAPWRMGANENTVFTVSHAVKIQGQKLPAGSYGLHAIVGKDEWTLIFSKNSTSWGSFFYDPSEDALRVTVKPEPHDYRESLTFEFPKREANKAVAEMQWEDLKIAWTIEVEQEEELYISLLKEELRTATGFNWRAFVAASQYCIQTKKHLDLALDWADAAIARPFVGEKNFQTLSNKSQVLDAIGKKEDAKTLLLEAVKHPTAQPTQIHQLGRQMQAAGDNKGALEIFEMNHKKNGDEWPVHVGLARGYMGVGDKAKALEHARKAAAQAPDEVNRKNLGAMVKALESGEAFRN
jgi:hypothetical protein